MIPMITCSRERRLTIGSRRDANESAIRESCPGCTGPSPAPNLPQIGRELGGGPVLWGTVFKIGRSTVVEVVLWIRPSAWPPRLDTSD